MLSQKVFIGSQTATKMQRFKNQGLSNLRIISDFDRTLTQAYANDEPVPTSFSILEKSGILSSNYVFRVQQLYNKYRQIELDNNLNYDIKTEKMKEWWLLTMKAIVEEKMHRETFKSLASSEKIVWRTGAVQLLNFSKQQQLPFAILSAGLGNVIEEFINFHQVTFDLLKIMANYFKFSQTGLAEEYIQPLIHSVNKSESVMSQYLTSQEIADRHNVILLGDQLGDAGMCSNTDQIQVLKIGFLNENIEDNLLKFQTAFDVVLTGDAPLDYVGDFLSSLVPA